MYEVLTYYRRGIDRSDVLQRLSLVAGEYFVVSAHREENIDSSRCFRDLISVLRFLADHYKIPVVVSVHPRTRKRIDSEGISLPESIQLMKPLGFFDYVHLMVSARTTLSDSGTISEESSILNFRALNIREAHERPEAMEEGAVMMTGLQPDRILSAMCVLDAQPGGAIRALNLVDDYAPSNVSEKVARIILSYTDYINRLVWKKADSTCC